MLTTRTSSPSFQLVDDATLREWLRLDPSTDAATLSLLLAAATDYLEGQTGLVLAAADYTIVIDAMAPCVAMPVLPLNSVAGVVANLSDGTTQALTSGTDYMLAQATSQPSLTFVNLPTNAQTVTVTCNAGYMSAASVPASLQHAAAVLVAAGYDNRSALDPKTVETVANLIQRYRRVGL